MDSTDDEERLIDCRMTGTDFLRDVVDLVLNEARIVGTGQHETFVDFRYPHEIEVIGVRRTALSVAVVPVLC